MVIRAVFEAVFVDYGASANHSLGAFKDDAGCEGRGAIAPVWAADIYSPMGSRSLATSSVYALL